MKTINELDNRPYFFDKGLCFECQQCGVCCTGDSGTIYITSKEIEQVADYLNIAKEIFIKRYLYPFRDSYSIKEDKKGNCLFYNNGCLIYPIRPHQCKSYPFWFNNLRSEDCWQKVNRECPGIGKGRLFSKEEILSIINTSAIPY